MNVTLKRRDTTTEFSWFLELNLGLVKSFCSTDEYTRIDCVIAPFQAHVYWKQIIYWQVKSFYKYTLSKSNTIKPNNLQTCFWAAHSEVQLVQIDVFMLQCEKIFLWSSALCLTNSRLTLLCVTRLELAVIFRYLVNSGNVFLSRRQPVFVLWAVYPFSIL